MYFHNFVMYLLWDSLRTLKRVFSKRDTNLSIPLFLSQFLFFFSLSLYLLDFLIFIDKKKVKNEITILFYATIILYFFAGTDVST